MENRHCWSSLLPELIDRIAGCLLDTADIDCYMELRAVCRSWRAATADPRNTLDRRFRPHHWVMLDYPSHGKDARVLVNTATGRFHGKDMRLLRKYYVVSVTTDGLLVLATRAFPHAACVLNPFTGYMVRFAAPMMPNVLAAAVSGSSPPYLVLYCYDTRKLYSANPDSESFVRYKKKYAYPLVRKAVHGCISIDGDQGQLPPLPAAVVTKIVDLITPDLFLPDLPDDEIDVASVKLCFLVESAGETLVIFKLENRMEVYKVDMDGNALERVNSIGSRAIFMGGCHRCLSVDADKFPSIEANCIYFVDRLSSLSIDIYHLKDGEKDQSASGVCGDDAASVNLPTFLCNPLTAHPFNLIQLLSVYTFNMQSSQVTQILQHEERVIEDLRTGQRSLANILLEASRSDSDSDN